MNPEQIDLPTICKHGLELRHCPLCVWPYEENTMKTPEQINRLIAESGLFQYPEIIPMGGEWKIHKPNTPYYQEFYEAFDPYHRIEHAMMALEKFENYNLHKRTWDNGTLGHRCSIENPVYCSSQWVATPSAAISEAIVAAVEGKE